MSDVSKSKALLIEKGGPFPSAASLSLASFDFVFVPDRSVYDAVADAGAQPILPSMSFSETDQRGSWRSLLGPLHHSWRLRRYLMNEEIDELSIPRSARQASTLLACVLAGTRVRTYRPNSA